MENHFCAHDGQGPNGFWEPHVVANGNAESADVGDIENTEIGPRRDPDFVREEREHLAVATDDLAGWIDDGGGVVQKTVSLLED